MAPEVDRILAGAGHESITQGTDAVAQNERTRRL
jgi:hypothetical protein